MNLFEKIKYELWPVVKVRLTYWWWIVKYGGKENIPREVVFGAMEKSMRRMNENLQNALRAMPDDTTEEEKKELMDLIREAGDLDRMREEAERER